MRTKFSRLAALILVALCANLAAFAELRGSICIVKPKATVQAKAVFSDFQTFFARNDEAEIADNFRAEWEDKVSGSGFVVKAAEGVFWVVTNRHVVQSAQSATLSFESSDGVKTELPDCPVVAVDFVSDLAFVEIPAAKLPAGALTLAASVPPDGTDVWSAGYPGLISKPSWQLGRGIISNRNLSVEELGRPADAVFVQHTAPIDPGNSGGPLMVGNVAKPEELRVIGVNTWAAGRRNNTFFSVPVNKLQEALDRAVAMRAIRAAMADKAADSEKLVAAQAALLVDLVNGEKFDEFAYQRIVSFEAATTIGAKPFLKELRSMASKDRKSWLTQLIGYSSLDTLRKYYSYTLFKTYHRAKDKLQYDGVEDAAGLAKGEAVLKFSQGKVQYRARWIIDSGNWSLAEFNIGKAKPSAATKADQSDKADKSDKSKGSDDGETGIGKTTTSGFVLGGGITLPLATSVYQGLGMAAKIGYDLDFAPFIGMQVGLGVQNEHVDSAEYTHDYYGYPTYTKTNYLDLGIDFGLKLKLPISIGKGYIMPYAIGGFGIYIPLEQTQSNSISSSYSNVLPLSFGLNYGFGVEFSFDTEIAFGAELSWIRQLSMGAFTQLAGRGMPVIIYVKFVNDFVAEVY